MSKVSKIPVQIDRGTDRKRREVCGNFLRVYTFFRTGVNKIVE